MKNQSKLLSDNAQILVIGDLILDEYVTCSQSYSRSEDVRELRIIEQRYFAGGAANVAMNLNAMGAYVYLFGQVGNDSSGQILKDILDGKNVDTKGIDINEYSTVKKTRFFDTSGTFLFKLLTEHRLNKSDMYQFKNFTRLENLLNQINAVVVSDYELGILQKRSLTQLISLLKEKKIPVFVDPRSDDPSKYKGATVLTPTLQEFNRLIGSTYTNFWDAIPSAILLMKDQEFEMIILKDGSQGCLLITPDIVSICPALNHNPVCTIGAGDSLLSGFVMAYINGASSQIALNIGSIAAAEAISHPYTYAVPRNKFSWED
ncbi:MAG: PfkB family carbohydrate kinase [Bacillota bacterium]